MKMVRNPMLAWLAGWLWMLGGATQAEVLSTAVAQIESVEREQVFDGTVEAVHRTTVSAQTAGRVLEVLYDVDDYVEKGEVIVRLRDAEQRAQMERARAALGEARARFEQARIEFARIRELYEKNLVAESRYDQAKAEKKFKKLDTNKDGKVSDKELAAARNKNKKQKAEAQKAAQAAAEKSKCSQGACPAPATPKK